MEQDMPPGHSNLLNQPKSESDELELIIYNQSITTLFQPIIDLTDGSVFAYEAQSRAPRDSSLHMPNVLFSVAREQQRTTELACMCLEKSIQNFSVLALEGKLALNIDLHLLLDPNFETSRALSLLREQAIPNHKIILELTEYSRTDSYEELKSAVAHYRSMGFAFALNGLGAGYSTFRLMLELEPEFIKLDKYFIPELSQNKKSSDFMKLIVDLAAKINCKVIAEGVEKFTELQAICDLGVAYAQGSLLGQPNKHPSAISLDLFPAQKNQNNMQEYFQNHHQDFYGEHVSSLSLFYVEPCSSDMLISDVLVHFQKDCLLQTIPVMEGSKVVGVLERTSILQSFSTAFAHSLNHKKVAADFMYSHPVVFKTSDQLTYTSEVAMQRPAELMYSPIIICDDSGYLGMAPIRELLERMTQNQLKHAKQCNPLTGLPGNISIEAEINYRLSQDKLFTCCYFDLDNFKAFNDIYGFERGDLLIGLVAELLGNCKEAGDFVGHIGGDDFVFISSRMDWEESIQNCLKDFEKRVPYLYNESDQKKGYIISQSRTGEQCKFPLSSLSVAGLPCEKNRFSSRLELIKVLFQLKHFAKSKLGNCLVIDQRK